MLGAFDARGRLIGFCYGFVGLREGGPFLYSHMAAVVEAWRGRDVGFRLKQAQREAALARGLDRIVWTFDPLQAGNAAFNLHKLGAVARRYYVDYYGEMTDRLNQGLGSDRLEVDWHLSPLSPPPQPEEASTETAAAPWGLEPSRLEPLPAPADPVTNLEASAVRLAIPRDIATLREADAALARRWREASRHAFQTYLERGYAAVDFAAGDPVGYYVLRREHTSPLAAPVPGRDA